MLIEPAWETHAPAQPVCARTSLLHALNLHSTPLMPRPKCTQKQRVHTGRAMMRTRCRLPFLFLGFEKAATERVSSVFLALALRRGFTSSEELWCLCRPRVKSGSPPPARLTAVRSEHGRKRRGDTGHCNEHLGHTCVTNPREAPK